MAQKLMSLVGLTLVALALSMSLCAFAASTTESSNQASSESWPSDMNNLNPIGNDVRNPNDWFSRMDKRFRDFMGRMFGRVFPNPNNPTSPTNPTNPTSPITPSDNEVSSTPTTITTGRPMISTTSSTPMVSEETSTDEPPGPTDGEMSTSQKYDEGWEQEPEVDHHSSTEASESTTPPPQFEITTSTTTPKEIDTGSFRMTSPKGAMPM